MIANCSFVIFLVALIGNADGDDQCYGIRTTKVSLENSFQPDFCSLILRYMMHDKVINWHKLS